VDTERYQLIRFHIEEAKRLLKHLQDHAPAPHRTSMIENVPLHRAIHET